LSQASHAVAFVPSGRKAVVPEGSSILDAVRAAGEQLPAECGGRGACGRCLVRVVQGDVPGYRVLRHDRGEPCVLACITPVRGPLVVLPMFEGELPKLGSRESLTGVEPTRDWAPWPLVLEPLVSARDAADLGVAVDVGTTTLRLVVARLADGVIVGEAGAYNPQIPRGADVLSRIVAAQRGLLHELAASVRLAVRDLVIEAAGRGGADPERIRAYVAAGNLTMMHLLLARDPSGIRKVPSVPDALGFAPVAADALGWPAAEGTSVHVIDAAGGWVGGDIMAGVSRVGLPREAKRLTLYVDLGTNGEIALGNADFALACACSAGPAFEGGGIRCGMRADRGAIDGARVDPDRGVLEVSTVGGGRARGVCGSGLISLADALLRAGWIDRAGKLSDLVPGPARVRAAPSEALSLSPDGSIALWQRDLASLVRAKGAIFAGIRTLAASLGEPVRVDRVVVSGNFGRWLNLPAAIGIGLLPDLPLDRYAYVGNGSLEGAALALLSRSFADETRAYVRRVTYVDLADLPGYMDELVGACFLPHTDPEALRIG
jgi:uncharacterized 2Fe-2S/4Fe-4S cluster protein (DUF4445 family)